LVGVSIASGVRQAGSLVPRGRNYARRYWPFVVPAGVVVAAVIVFPWIFTLYMSVHDWHIGGAQTWAGLANYERLLTDDRFQWSVIRTLYFTALAVFFPMLFGIAAAVCFEL
jgi:multiple sugar transport system permease protein